MLQCFFHRLGALAVLFTLAGCVTHAAVSVTELAVSGTGAPYDVVYVLNTVATTGTIEFLDSGSVVVRTGALSGAALSKGVHHFSWNGKNNSNADVPGGSYRARITVTADAVPSGGQKLWGTVDVVSASSAPTRFTGPTVNRNPGSPYLGRIYVPSYSDDYIAVYSSDGTFVRTFTYGVISDLNDPFHPFSAGVRGAFVGADDRLYCYFQSDATQNVVAGCLSMMQDGTDIVFEAGGTLGVNEVSPDFTASPRFLYVTGTGAARRFYYTQNTGFYAGPTNVVVQTPGGSPVTIIAAASTGPADGLVVLDSNNDPAGHASSVTVYVRSNGTANPLTENAVRKWDGNDADPTFATFTEDVAFSTSTALPSTITDPSLDSGQGLSRDPDGSLWAPRSGASTDATRGYIKLDAATGAEIAAAKINVPSGDGRPRFNGCDLKGNTVAETITETTAGSAATRAKFLLMYAPPDSGSTDAEISAPFAVSGVVLPPILINAGPTVSNVTSNSAVVSWTTDIASTSELAYGLSAISLPNNLSLPALTTGHAVTIPGLTKLTPYFYQVRSTADGYAAAQSGLDTFTTKDTLVISNLAATSTQTTATVTFTTDKPTDTTVLYGLTPDTLNLSASGNTNTTSHTAAISGLTEGTTYYFVVQSGSATVETTTSTESFFATLAANGTKARTLTSWGDFKFGILDDIFLTAGDITLNRKAVPAVIDDAGVADLPEGVANHAVVAYGGYLYVLGGRHPAINKATVYFAPINSDGTVAAWKETTPLLDELFFTPHAAFGYNGCIYLVGGAIPTTQLTTIFARQNPLDGTLGSWAVAGSFPAAAGNEREIGATSVWNGNVYYCAGEDDTAIYHADTYIAGIKPDGTLTDWTVATELLPQAVVRHAMTAHNGRLFLWGGTADGIAALPDLQASVLGGDGQPAAWAVLNAGATGRFGFAGTITHGYALEVAGVDLLGRTSRVSYAQVNADNTTDMDWTDTTLAYSDGNPLRDMDGGAWQNRYYVIGGRNGDSSGGASGDAVALATALVFEPGADYVPHGRYEAQIIDLGQVEALQTLAVTATGSVALSTRIAGADGVFGAWTPPGSLSVNFSGATARYVQFALDLSSDGPTAATVSSIALGYGTPQAPYATADVQEALRIAAGIDTAGAPDMARLDLVKADGTAGSDGKITAADATAIQRKLNGR